MYVMNSETDVCLHIMCTHIFYALLPMYVCMYVCMYAFMCVYGNYFHTSQKDKTMYYCMC